LKIAELLRLENSHATLKNLKIMKLRERERDRGGGGLVPIDDPLDRQFFYQ